jgi:hypothetical protein
LSWALIHPRWLYVSPNGDVLVADDVGNVIWRVSSGARAAGGGSSASSLKQGRCDTRRAHIARSRATLQ